MICTLLRLAIAPLLSVRARSNDQVANDRLGQPQAAIERFGLLGSHAEAGHGVHALAEALDGIGQTPLAPRLEVDNLAPSGRDERLEPLFLRLQAGLIELRREHAH